ncbi:hypothetical protein BBJ28_00020012 [Nothophytophthora sp. Chile5]|nr:hypothetical protein BBJ28_00020012 [Nothophytophthora sp. Chile5]
MSAHGELVHQLERELESRRLGEAELRLEVAKLSTSRARWEDMKLQKDQLAAKNEEICQRATTQATEIARLSALVAIKQQDVESATLRAQVLVRFSQHANPANNRRREFQRRAFDGWKDSYLRGVVGQATHAAMISQPQQRTQQRSTADFEYRNDLNQSWAMPAAIRPIPSGHYARAFASFRPLSDNRKQEPTVRRAMTQAVDGNGESCSPSKRGSGGGSTHPPLFESPSKRGVHHTIATFTATERRFHWQEGSSATDALYQLPSSIGTGAKKSFGTSTREDWDVARKRMDPGAGPGSYQPPQSCGKQPSSECRTAAFAAFENAPRTPLQGDTTPSPGPIYDLPVVLGAGSPAAKQGTALRPPLSGKNDGPGPNLMLPGSFPECRAMVSPTFGTEARLKTFGTQQTPGPIYDLRPTGFSTGPRSSFSHAKRF